MKGAGIKTLVAIAGAGLLNNVVEVDAFSRFIGDIPYANGAVIDGQTWRGLGHPTPDSPVGNANDPNNRFGPRALAFNTWLTELCEEDSDGDGLTNGEELCDPNCEYNGGPDPVCPDGQNLSHPGFADPFVDGGIPPLLLLHAACMIIAWIFFAPVGILGATLFKKSGSPPTWFKVHRALLSGASILTLLGFVFILSQVGGFQLIGTHPRLGITVVFLAIVQPLSGFFRAHLPAMGEEKSLARKIWEPMHQWMGRLIMILAVASLITGIGIGFPNEDATNAAGFVLAAALGLAGVGSFGYVFLFRDVARRSNSQAEAKQKAEARIFEQKTVPTPVVVQDVKRAVPEVEAQDAAFPEVKVELNERKAEEVTANVPILEESVETPEEETNAKLPRSFQHFEV